MSSAEGSEDQSGSDSVHELRNQLLVLPPDKLGIQPTDEFPQAYGVLMEIPIDEHTATIVSLCDGHASVYTTSTFSVIGGTADESTRQKARAFVKAAGRHYADAVVVSEFPYPEPGRVRFYILGFDGVRMIDTDLDEVSDGTFHELFDHGQELFADLESVVVNAESNNASSSKSGGWSSSLSWYTHCLLTCMGEGSIATFELEKSDPVPDLLDLVDDNEGLREWLVETQMSTESLTAKQVIRSLRRQVRGFGLPFFPRQAELHGLHHQEDGQVIGRVFEVALGAFNNSIRLDLLPDDDPRVVAKQKEANSQINLLKSKGSAEIE